MTEKDRLRPDVALAISRSRMHRYHLIDDPHWTDEYHIALLKQSSAHRGPTCKALAKNIEMKFMTAGFAELTDAVLWSTQLGASLGQRSREADLERENAKLRELLDRALRRLGPDLEDATSGQLAHAQEATRLAVVESFGHEMNYVINTERNSDAEVHASHDIAVSIRSPESATADELAAMHSDFYDRLARHLVPEASRRVRVSLRYESPDSP